MRTLPRSRVLTLTLAAVCALLSTQVHAADAWKGRPAPARVAALVAALEREDVTKIDVFQISPQSITRIPITPAALERIFEYRLTIRNITSGKRAPGFLEAVRTIEVTETGERADVRWGVVVYDRNDKRKAELFFDKAGSLGTFDGVPVTFRGRFFEWLVLQFSPCFSG